MAVSIPPESGHLEGTPGPCCAWHSTEISADTDEIWATLENFEDWENWNPLYVESNGVLSEGQYIEFAVALPGMKPQRGKAQVVKVRPPEFIQYEIKSLGGLVRGTRFIEIKQLAPARCLVVNGEIMSGLLGAVLYRFMGERVAQGLEAMNTALKARLENDKQGEKSPSTQFTGIKK